MYLVRARLPARRRSSALTPNNAQGELYLTDVVAAAARAGGVASVAVADDGSLARHQRSRAARRGRGGALRAASPTAARRAGATVRDGARIDAGVVVEPDAVIEHAVVLRGATRIGAGARVDVGSRAHRRGRRRRPPS